MSGSEVEPIRKWSPHCSVCSTMYFYEKSSDYVDWFPASYPPKKQKSLTTDYFACDNWSDNSDTGA